MRNAWAWVMSSSSFCEPYFSCVRFMNTQTHEKKELETMAMWRDNDHDIERNRQRNRYRISSWPVDPDYKMQVLNTCISVLIIVSLSITCTLARVTQRDLRSRRMAEINLATNHCESIQSIERRKLWPPAQKNQLIRNQKWTFFFICILHGFVV